MKVKLTIEIDDMSCDVYIVRPPEFITPADFIENMSDYLRSMGLLPCVECGAWESDMLDNQKCEVCR